MFIGISLALSQPRAAIYTFANAEAATLVARFTTQPTSARKALIDTLVGSLKAGSVWSKLDALYILAAADSQASRQNWIANQYNLSLVNTPTFVADRGWTGTAGNGQLSSGFDASTAVSPKFTQNSASMFVWSRTDVNNAGGTSHEAGCSNANMQRVAATSGRAGGRPCSSADAVIADAAFPGLAGWSRVDATTCEGYAQGVDGGGGVLASAAVSGDMRVTSATGAGFGRNQLATAGWGQSLTAGEHLALYNALNAYLVAVGAA
jgi:hypothetical protein